MAAKKPTLDPIVKAEILRIKAHGGICATLKWAPCRSCGDPAPTNLGYGDRHAMCPEPARKRLKKVENPNQLSFG